MAASEETKTKTLVYLDAPNRFGWDPTVLQFNQSLRRAGMRAFQNEPWRIVTVTAKALAKLRLLRNFFKLPSAAYVAVIMQAHEAGLFPVCYFYESVVYCYDCWPEAYARWESLFIRQAIEVAFFSARQSARYFASRFPGMECMWLPEATDPSLFVKDKLLKERKIDVLELGRRHQGYHSLIAQTLSQRRFQHLFESAPGSVVFSGNDALISGLADSKVSILFPSSMTHPARSGDVETLTQKYLQSIASGCVLLGHCPEELKDLFGYNPVIEADFGNPSGQVIEILTNIDDYQELVNRNYARLLVVGTWDIRVATMIDILASRFYGLKP